MTGKSNIWRKNCPIGSSNPTWTGLGSNAGFYTGLL